MYYTNNDASAINEHINQPRLLDIDRMLMGNGNRVDGHQLSQVSTPRGTHTHVPVPHSACVEIMKSECNNQGLNIVQETHLLDKDNNRYFGLFQVSGGKDVSTIIGLRNSHDKSIPIGVCVGDAPFVCSNLCFNNEFVVKARHTFNVYSTIVERMRDVIAQAVQHKGLQQHRVDRMRNTNIWNNEGDAFIWDAVKDGAITLKQGFTTREQWRNPEHNEFRDRNVWSLQNAFTNTLRKERNRHTHLARTGRIRQLIDKEFTVAV